MRRDQWYSLLLVFVVLALAWGVYYLSKFIVDVRVEESEPVRVIVEVVPSEFEDAAVQDRMDWLQKQIDELRGEKDVVFGKWKAAESLYVKEPFIIIIPENREQVELILPEVSGARNEVEKKFVEENYQVEVE